MPFVVVLLATAHASALRPAVLRAAAARPTFAPVATAHIRMADALAPAAAPRPPSRPLVARAARLAAAAAALAAAPAWAAAKTAAGAAGAAGASAGKLHIGQKLALSLQSSGLPNELILALISMLPVVELRGAVPVGSWLGVPPVRTFVVCVLGNSLAVLLLLLALRLPLVESLLAKVLEKARAKIGPLATAKSLPLGLAVFVGVPLPGTGGWTGAMIAHLLGMPLGLAFGSIAAGVAMAGVIMSALTLAGWYGAALAAAALGVFCVGALLNKGK